MNHRTMLDEQSMDFFREELKKSQKTCTELRTANLRQEETIQKLTAELKALQTSSATHLTAAEKQRDIPRKRAKAIERNRIEYEDRLGAAYQTDFSYAGYDEIDS